MPSTQVGDNSTNVCPQSPKVGHRKPKVDDASPTLRCNTATVCPIPPKVDDRKQKESDSSVTDCYARHNLVIRQ